jgi:hypothetical protein
MKRLLAIALLTANCSGSSTAPSSSAAPPPSGPTRDPAQFNQTFWNELVHDAYDTPGASKPLRRWTTSPSLYLKTVDEAGVVIDAVTLQTVEDAMRSAATTWGGGTATLAAVERGTSSREGQTGWVTVKWPNPSAGDFCGLSQVAVDGGWIELNYLRPSGCGCGGSKMWARAARHELGHAFGFYHTDSASDVMSINFPIPTCDQVPSAREVYHAQLAYQTPIGSTTALRPALTRVVD